MDTQIHLRRRVQNLTDQLIELEYNHENLTSQVKFLSDEVYDLLKKVEKYEEEKPSWIETAASRLGLLICFAGFILFIILTSSCWNWVTITIRGYGRVQL